ncbi:MAG: hypothetical protein AAF614_42315 [Chloroflexota bacterium]
MKRSDFDSKQENPYVGPRSFKLEEAVKFFGRDIETHELEAMIIARRLVLFYAPSGAGKSSLLNTKIRPLLRREGFEPLPTGRVSGFTGNVNVANIFVYNLLLSLQEEAENAAELAHLTLAEFLDNFVRSANGNYHYDPDYIYPDDMELKPRVLIIDQFEELLTTNPAYYEQRGSFFEQMSDALRYDEDLHVVLTMREDFVAQLDSYLHLMPNRLRHRYYMERLARDAALEAITRPVVDLRPFTPEAANQLVDNLLRIRTHTNGQSQIIPKQFYQFVEPVQLQAVCYQMWEKLRHEAGDTITKADVLSHADVDTALINFYEETIAKTVQHKQVSEIELRVWFDRELITEAGTRNMVFRGDEAVGSLPTDVADFIRQQFILGEVVRPGGSWYELVHDSFVAPIMMANQKWQQEQPLIRLAQSWDENGRLSAYLLNGQQLDQLDERDWQALGPLVADYVAAGREAQRRAAAAKKKAEDAQQAREMAQQEQLARQNHALAVASKEQAHQARKFASAQEQSRRRMSYALIAVVTFLILALIGAGLSILAQGAAELSREVAEQAQDVAELQATRAYQAQLEAEAARQTAIPLQITAEAGAAQAYQGQLAAQAAATSESELLSTAQGSVAEIQETLQPLIKTATSESTYLQATVAHAEIIRDNLEELVSTLSITLTPTPQPSATPLPSATPTIQSNAVQITFSGTVNGAQNLLTYRYLGNVGSGQVTTLTSDSAEQQDADWSCSQRLAYVRKADEWQLIVRDGDVDYEILTSSQTIRRPSWAPDGKTLAFDWGMGTGGNHDIYEISIPQANPNSTSEPRRLTSSTGNDFHPSYSPDGTSIVFYSLRDGNREIYTLNNIDTDAPTVKRLTNSPGDDQRPTWSPHLDTANQWIAFDSARDGDWDVWVMRPDGSSLTRLTSSTEYDWSPTWSPDGSRIAFISERLGFGAEW